MRTNKRPTSMQLNAAVRGPVTHEGGAASMLTPAQELRRTVLAALLNEETFYESGQSIVDRVRALAPQVDGPTVAALAVEARTTMNLRHMPLLLVREMARHASHKPYVEETLVQVIQRADEIGEFLAIYWQDGKQPLAASVKRGLARAFTRFDAYSLAKYDRRGDTVRLRDALFMVHGKPESNDAGENAQVVPSLEKGAYKRGRVLRHAAGQGQTWQQLIAGELPTPDTWETALSASKGADKKDVWERLLREQKLGALALLRNLRNMTEAGVGSARIAEALRAMKTDRVLPFRFVAAWRNGGDAYARLLEEKMLAASAALPRLAGRTAIVVDVSGSMDARLSRRSDMSRIDAATALATIGVELCDAVDIYSFSNRVVKVKTLRGFGLTGAIKDSQDHGGTYLRAAAETVFGKGHYDRVIVVTDEQSHDGVAVVPAGVKGYMINTAPYQPGVGYEQGWVKVDGFSEAVFHYISEIERL